MYRTGTSAVSAAAVACLLVASAFNTAGAPRAQEKEKSEREYYQAQAYGTSTQMGRTVNVSITINSYSTPDDQKALLKAFNEKGMEGMTKLLNKMKSKGRLAITGTLGYDLSYIRSFKTEQGRKLRMVTSRPITFAENYQGTRSTEYSLSAVELNLNDEESKSTGTLLPLCKLKMNKQNELEIEAYQNPWDLRNIMKR